MDLRAAGGAGGAERSGEREVLLKGRLQAALLHLNEWLTEEQAGRAIFDLEHVTEVGIARNQKIHEYLTFGLLLTVNTPRGQDTRNVRFFDFDHPEGGLNEFVVTTQFRVRRGNPSTGSGQANELEDDRRVIKPDLVLFVNGIPLVVLDAKSPSLVDVWKSQAVRQLHRYKEAGPEWHGTGAPELFHYNLLCVAHCGASAAYAATGAPENAYFQWKSMAPYSEDEVRQRFAVEPQGQAQLIVGLLDPATLLDILRDFVVYEPDQGRVVKKLPRYQQNRAVKSAMRRILSESRPEERAAWSGTPSGVNGKHCVCNRAENKFEVTDGDGYREWFNEKNRLTKGNLKRVVRLLKHLRDHKNSFTAKSILLTTLADYMIRPSDEGTQAVSTVADTLETVLTRMSEYLQQHPCMPEIKNPVLPTENFNRHWDQRRYANFRDRVKSYAATAKQAKAEQSGGKSIKLWQELFGESFGKGSSSGGGTGTNSAGGGRGTSSGRGVAGVAAPAASIPVAHGRRRNEAHEFG